MAAALTCAVGAAAGHVVPVAPAFGQGRAAGRPTSALVWQGEKVDVGGSVSPDGRYVSFVDWDAGDLMLRDLATDASRTVIATQNAKGGDWKVFAETSTISRDGRHVAYSWYDESRGGRYELRIANLRGEAKPRRVFGAQHVDWLAPRDWSPDGKWIAALLSLQDLTQQIALIAVDDGRVRPLKAGHWPGNTRAFFSPDGRYLAYDLPQDRVSARDVWVTAVDETTDSRVVAHRANDVAMGWSPDGRYLLFTSDRTGSTALFRLAMQDGTPRGAPVALKPDMGLTESLGVTRGGALLFGTAPGRRGGGIEVAQFDLESGAVTSPRDVSPSPQEDNVNPSWSPDGRYLAYVSARGRPGEPPAIVLRTADAGGLVREIEPKLRGAQLAGWAPDGAALLVVGGDPSGRSGAFRLDVETGEASFVFATPNAPTLSMPTWSADRHTLFYWNRVNGGAEDVFVAREIASGVERELVRRPFLGALLLSPDGRFLATETTDPNTNERVLLLVPVDGTAPRELMRLPSGVTGNALKRVDRGARVGPASWAPDSRFLIARLQRAPEGPSELWYVPIDGGSPRKLASVVGAHVFKFAISPDGRRVAYRIKEPEPALPKQIWKFEHFLPARSASK
jgi:Tol biopolymer transport system component